MCLALRVMSSPKIGKVVFLLLIDADVDMPIMSVTELAANGESGSDIVFRKNDGAIVDVKSDATSQFVRRKGVYFMKRFTHKNQVNNSGFIRPGSA